MKGYELAVEAVYIADEPSSFVTRRVGEIDIRLGGIPGDRHYGLLRKADSRQKLYPKGTMIANRRQISIISAEECRLIADKLGISEVRPEWLGANVLVAGMAEFTLLPPGARLLVPGHVGLICEGENMPCKAPGDIIERESGAVGAAARFVREAKQRRGIVCSVEREGVLRAGDTLTVVLP
ncbi:MOSC domain-containing protein [Paenibacillus puerhi]|uniref:MOSC domain-containing protein n=1 Tax=Paenibacillus puerhi TaxID=2692622 RepID=UPI001915AD86|nr:MOSC domain-containing protein [Paenibacillus puerhi]